MSVIFLIGGLGSMLLGPPTYEHVVPSVVIALIGCWGGLAMLAISLKEKPRERRISGEIRIINEQARVEIKRRPPQG